MKCSKCGYEDMIFKPPAGLRCPECGYTYKYSSTTIKDDNNQDDFVKYPKIKTLGHKENLTIFADGQDEIVIQEKIDGANFRFMFKGGKLLLGSRTRTLTNDNQEEKNWKRCCDYIKKTVPKHTKYEGYVFYGESCRRHTIGYNFENMPPFLGFDVLDCKTGEFLDWIIARDMFNAMGLTFVPIIKFISACDIVDISDGDIGKSHYYDGRCEGWVFKNYDKQIFAKYVRSEFKEDNKKTFGGTLKYEETDSGKVMCKFCTNARINKYIYKLRDDGHDIEMAMMKYLPGMVYNDIVTEEYESILISHYKIDCKQMKRIVSKRCAAVLKMLMINIALDMKK